MWTVVSHLRAQIFYHAWKRLMQRVAERKVNKGMIRGCFFTFKWYKVFVPEFNFIETYKAFYTKLIMQICCILRINLWKCKHWCTELIAGWSNTAGKPTAGLSYQTRNTRLEEANFVQGVLECLSKKLALRARTLNAALARYTPNYKHDVAEKWKKEKAK